MTYPPHEPTAPQPQPYGPQPWPPDPYANQTRRMPAYPPPGQQGPPTQQMPANGCQQPGQPVQWPPSQQMPTGYPQQPPPQWPPVAPGQYPPGTYPPPPVVPVPPKKGMGTGKLLLIIGAGFVGLCCVGGVIAAATSDSGKAGYNAATGATTPAAAPTTAKPTALPPTTKPPAPTRAAIPAVPDRKICQVTENSGSYYLYVTSAMDHNFSACTAAAPYSGSIDNLLNLPGMDRRCILGNDYTTANHAIVGVYSGSKAPDLSAARAFCDANGGTQ